MKKDGLTRREIGWLLAQEARGAAQALRRGIEIKVRDSLPPPSLDAPPGSLPTSLPYDAPVLDGLSALDDAIGLLGDLQARPAAKRRGRIDVAALLYELAPQATISLSATGGTEVFAEEGELRRILQLLLVDAGAPAHGSNAPEIRVQRLGDFVHISTELGPDAAPVSSLERRWLNRMATRLGGRFEMTGGGQSLILPAEGVVQEAELQALRQELAEAQELGEAYARELAGVLSSAEAHAAGFDVEPHDALTLFTRWAPALRLSLTRAGASNAPLARALSLAEALPTSEPSSSLELPVFFASQEGAAHPWLVSGKARFEAPPRILGALTRLFALAIEEGAADEAPWIFTARAGEDFLELSAAPPRAGAEPPRGFVWQLVLALVERWGGTASNLGDSQPPERRVPWVRVPERSAPE